jgi:hypothetical protein
MAAASGIAAGASAGAAFGPWGAAIGGIAGGLMDAGGGGAPPVPQNAESAVYGNGLDGSGWNVNFSGFQSNAANKATTGGDPSAAQALGMAGPGGSISPLLIVGVVALVGAALWFKSKK